MMVTGGRSFERFMSKHSRTIESLGRLGITLVGSFPEGGVLGDPELSFINASALEAGGVELLELAFRYNVLEGFPGPAVIDVERASIAHEALGKKESAEAVRTALSRGRVRLQGTDGVRGPVALSCEGDGVLAFGRTGEVTPLLIKRLSWAYGRMARRAGIARQGAKVVVAEDGRDAATGGRLSEAMKEGLTAAGLTVVDLGVAPTPAVPFAQARTGARLGAALTASHNPASQNGIKFFIDGFKMLPEGPTGDYALSAFAYAASHGGLGKEEKGSVEDGRGLLDDFAAFIATSLPEGAAETLRGLEVVFDPANGAFTQVGKRVFERLKMAVTSVNDRPDGHNINRGGGVAEIEGRREIEAGEARGSEALGSVAAVLARAKETGKAVYGLVMDGDGDRGMVVSAADGERAYVADGDAEAYILARYLRESGRISEADAASYEFVGTVESDLELFRNVRGRLGLSTSTSCVGDKWLAAPFRQGRKLAIGEECSGHVLWPIETKGPGGEARTVLAGNGILTALSALAASVRLRLSARETSRPFPEGTFITRYTYNVNKGLFFPGSGAWEADLRQIEKALGGRAREGFASWRVIEMADEADMLYVGLADESGGLSGAVFVRNSGTENKTAVYGRGIKALEPLLADLCLVLWQTHEETLKDTASGGYRIERAALEALAGGALSQGELEQRVIEALGGEPSVEAVAAALYGMRKEGLVGLAEGKIERRE